MILKDETNSKEYKSTEIGEIPLDWNVNTIEEIVAAEKNSIKIGPFGSQLKKDSLVAKGYKVYGQENIFVKDFTKGSRYITEEKFLKLKSSEIMPQDFIITMMGTIGKTAIVPEDIEPGIMDSHLLRIRLDTNKYLNEMLLHSINSEIVQNQIKKMSVGGIMSGLSSRVVRKINLPIPPLKEQQKIADILSAADKQIERTEMLIIKTKELKVSLMQKLLTKGIKNTQFKQSELGEIPLDWEVKTIEEITGDHKGSIKIGPFGSQLKKSSLVSEGYKVYGQENVFKKNFEVGSRFINEEKFSQLKSCELKPGDFVITMMGTIGKCAIIPLNIKRGIMDSHLIRIQLNKEVYLNELLIHSIGSEIVQNQIKRMSVGGIMAGLSSKVIRQIKLPVAPLIEQQKITDILSSVDYQIEGYEKQKEKQIELKKALMQQLLTGKLRVTV